eukprot:scaffold315452_cov27-Tisochrysis_lutea.AAC.4
MASTAADSSRTPPSAERAPAVFAAASYTAHRMGQWTVSRGTRAWPPEKAHSSSSVNSTCSPRTLPAMRMRPSSAHRARRLALSSSESQRSTVKSSNPALSVRTVRASPQSPWLAAMGAALYTAARSAAVGRGEAPPRARARRLDVSSQMGRGARRCVTITRSASCITVSSSHRQLAAKSKAPRRAPSSSGTSCAIQSRALTGKARACSASRRKHTSPEAQIARRAAGTGRTRAGLSDASGTQPPSSLTDSLLSGLDAVDVARAVCTADQVSALSSPQTSGALCHSVA